MLAALILLPFTVAEPFWVTAELLRVDWKDGCLTTALVARSPDSRYLKIYYQSPKGPPSASPSRALCAGSEPSKASRPFVSYWENDNPEDVTLSCQVVGSDLIYGFPKVCDQTVSVRVFQDEVVQAFGRNRRHQDITTSAIPEEELGKRLIEVRAKCFNAIIAVLKHTERFPWCPDPSHATIIEHEVRFLRRETLFADSPVTSPLIRRSVPSKLKFCSSQKIYPLLSQHRFSHNYKETSYYECPSLVLAGIAVSASLGFSCALVALLRQKSTYCHISVKPRYRPFSPFTCKTAEDENRYDTLGEFASVHSLAMPIVEFRGDDNIVI